MKYAILAAGEGSRLASEGLPMPKPMVPILGEPMIDRLIRIFGHCGAEEIIVITNDLAPDTHTHLRQLQQQGVPLRLVVKTTPSSMHSFHALQPMLGTGRFCLTTVDTIFREQEFIRFIDDFQRSKADGLMAVTSYVDDEKPLWVSTTPQLRITGFHDSQAQFAESEAGRDGTSVCQYISGGIYCLTDRAFPVLRQCIDAGQSRMRNFQRALCRAGLRLQAWPFEQIVDVDHARDIAVAENFLNTSPKTL